MARRAHERISVEASSGNIFADIGLPDAAEADTKYRLEGFSVERLTSFLLALGPDEQCGI